jgi:hypothetical protein
MEANPLADYPEEIELVIPEEEMPLPDKPYDYTGMLFLILAAVVALIIVIIVVVSRKKKNAPEDDSGKDHTEPFSQPASVQLQDEQFHQHIAMEDAKMTLQVWISKNGMKTTQTVWQLGSSLIVGRSSICDICIDDGQMSRQHFCLEAVNGEVYISDLNSTNGTSVNGIRIDRKRKLENGAVIEAGSIKFTVRW